MMPSTMPGSDISRYEFVTEWRLARQIGRSTTRFCLPFCNGEEEGALALLISPAGGQNDQTFLAHACPDRCRGPGQRPDPAGHHLAAAAEPWRLPAPGARSAAGQPD